VLVPVLVQVLGLEQVRVLGPGKPLFGP
jgi:hypothetical protein